MRTLIITSGHEIRNGKGTGVISKYGDEAIEARKFVTALAKDLYKKYNIMTYTDSDTWTLRETIAWIGTRINKSKYTIDIHFNAFINPEATGTEVIVPKSHSKEEILIAKDIVNLISSILEIPKRKGSKIGIEGIKDETESQHPKLGILSDNRLASVNNILIELCFISNSEDMKKYNSNFNKLIENISAIINNHLK